MIFLCPGISYPLSSGAASPSNSTFIGQLRHELARMEAQSRRAMGDYYPKCRRVDSGSEAESAARADTNVELPSSDAVNLSIPASMVVGRTYPEIGSAEWRSQNARTAVNAKHDRPGGSREKQIRMRGLWATGKYFSRDVCAEQECAALGMSFAAARKALKGTPDPTRR